MLYRPFALASAKPARAARPPLGQVLRLAFLIFAFALQSYVVQTHIHAEDFANPLRVSPAHAAAPDAGSKPGNNPFDDGSDKCPLCQLLHGGQYLTPKLAPLFIALAAVTTVRQLFQQRGKIQAASHSWRGRAPPQA